VTETPMFPYSPSDESGKLLEEIEVFLETTHMACSTFGLWACGNPHLVTRLRDRRDVTTATIDKVREFIQDFKKRPVKFKPKL